MPETAPPLSVLDTEAFRRKLAGLADPLARDADTPGERAEIRELAAEIVATLADLFGANLDRKTMLWSRIGSALESADAKVSDDDLDRYLSLCLEHVRAEPGRAAAHEGLGSLLATFAARPPEWRFALLHYLRSHRYPVLQFGRRRWDEIKASRVGGNGEEVADGLA